MGISQLFYRTCSKRGCLIVLSFSPSGLDEPRPHMLLGIIVRSKVLFKRPRALSQRSLSPPPKRRTSSASVETSSSEGGTGESPASKQGMLTDLHDSPPADIDDIVFQYNTTQARIASKKAADSPAKASPTSGTSTPSMASSSGAVVSPPSVAADKSSVPSLEAQKQQLLDLQERARQYILAQTQRKETASVNDEPEQEAEEKLQTSVTSKDGEGKMIDDDAPYDPEEGLELDLDSNDLTDPTPAKPAVPVSSQESSKPSSLQMLVSTLQRLQSAAVKSVSPHLASLSTALPMGSSTVSSDTVPAGTADTVKPAISGGFGIQSIASASSILQPIVPGSRDLQPVSSPDSAPQLSSRAGQQPVLVGFTGQPQQRSVTADRQPVPDDRHTPLPAGATDRQPVSASLTGHMPQRNGIRGVQVLGSSEHSFQSRVLSDQRHQPTPEESRHTNRWNPSEPPQVTRQVNNVTQQVGQYSGLRPEERARLAAHESRLEARESRRVPNEHRDEHHEQRRMDDRTRGAWYNDTRYPRDSRLGHSNETRYPRDSRTNDSNEPHFPRDFRAGDSRGDWRHQHRHDDEQRRERHGYPLNERPRYEERREERRFKEHWSRDRWRR